MIGTILLGISLYAQSAAASDSLSIEKTNMLEVQQCVTAFQKKYSVDDDKAHGFCVCYMKNLQDVLTDDDIKELFQVDLDNYQPSDALKNKLHDAADQCSNELQ